MKRMILTLAVALGAFAAHAQQLYIGSYNVTSTAEEGSYGDGNDKWANRMPVICDMFNFEQADVVGMQSMDKDQYADLRSGMAGYQTVGVGADDGEEAGLFAPIFCNSATVELLESGHFWLSDTPDKASKFSGAANSQVCTWAKLRKGQSAFYVFNVCLDTNADIAKASASLVLGRMQEMNGDGLPCFLTASIGADEQSEVYAQLAAQLADAYASAGVVSAEYGTLNAFNLASNHGTSRYDFVFAGTSGINVDSYGQLQYGYFTTSGGNATRRLPSAHFPVMAKATLSH